MERSKGYALMFLLGAFLTGGALGFTADRVIGPDRGKDHRGGRVVVVVVEQVGTGREWQQSLI